jgi:hypothetical protein
MPNLQEDLAIWIADLNLEHLADELRRRTLGKPSRHDFARVSDDVIHRAVWAHRRDLEALAQ